MRNVIVNDLRPRTQIRLQPRLHSTDFHVGVQPWLQNPRTMAYGGAVARTEDWVLLSYRLPREPSTVRVSVWRKLRRLGVAQVLDGLVALPADARTREQLEWIAQEVLAADGDAAIWLARPSSRAQERALVQQMTESVAADYAEVIAAAREARRLDDATRARTVTRLRRELGRIRPRDFFPPPARERAQQAVDQLAAQDRARPTTRARSRS